ncbi:MAG TPA: type I methionyl aminopeptidase [Syntrophales bacterium]|nr:type I methionyl aminopeptidase [Syntrophales bacterium]HQB29335.1 type I methionyl aminopeptidase [Syntrophales bacterium]HQN77500.1 type I methionyl aminopeptidase [Syntrophales bacterium]HQQ27545.1 type I methionyl aminopeptidase [Syntrophales bacterium]
MIILKSREEIEKIRKSNRIAAQVLEKLREMIAPGVTTADLDRVAEEMSLKNSAKPAFKGYRGYPASLCTSINSEVVHGIPSARELREGDIVSLDFGILFDGYYGDSALTVPVKEVSPEAMRLIRVTRESLYRGIEEARAGNRLGDISAAVQEHVEAAGFSVVRDYVGHGIGKSLHEDPQIPNYGTRGRGIVLKKGMVLAIEPMVNEGGYGVRVTGDGWTVITEDGKLSAHFEHTIAISDDGPEILSVAE